MPAALRAEREGDLAKRDGTKAPAALRAEREEERGKSEEERGGDNGEGALRRYAPRVKSGEAPVAPIRNEE